MLFLIFLFTVLPVVELMLLFKAGAVIGGWNTVAIVILTGVAGASMARSQGLSLLHKIQTQMQRGEVPTDSLLQGFLVFGGGLLLMTPGFITDIVGFCMVMPGTRKLFAKLVKAYFLRKIQTGRIHVVHGPFPGGPRPRSPFDEPPFGEPREIKDANVIDVKDVSEKPED